MKNEVVNSHIFYVKPLGLATGKGTKEEPFGSIEYAKACIRKMIDSLSGEVVVLLADGVYSLQEPLVFTNEDCGKNLSIVYRAENEGKAILTGGKKVVGWSSEDGELYQAKVEVDHVRNMYVNGVRAILAREPNGESFHKINGWEEGRTRVRVKKSLLKGAKKFEGIYYLEWSECVVRVKEIREVDDSSCEVILEPEENESKYFKYHVFHPVQMSDSMLIRFQNAREFLDVCGEFFFDESTKTLYYYPRPGEDMKTAEVVVPCAESIIVLAGEEKNRVKNISFEGLVCEYTEFKNIHSLGFMEIQAAHHCCCYREGSNEQLFDMPKGAIHLQNAENISLNKLKIQHIGGTGINLYFGVANVDICKCCIKDISSSGITMAPFINGIIQDDNLYMPSNANITVHDVKVLDNYIADCGVEFTRSPSLTNVLGHDITMEHNEIAYGNYTGISNGWGWSLNDYVVCRNKILYNNVHHVGMKGSDLGGIYNLNNQKGTEIIGNYVHEINKGKNGFSEGSPAEGIYLDEGTNHLVVKDNQVAYAGEIGRLIYTNVAGSENEVVNNKGKMCGDILDEQVVLSSGVRDNSVLPYDTKPTNGLCEAIRSGSWRKYTGKFGCRFEVQEDITVTSLGRFYLQGNIGKHKIALYDDSLNLIVESEIDCKEQMHRKNGFIYSKVNETELQKGKKYYLLTEERAEDDYFCGSDTVQYFSKEIRFLCGVSLVENIRKEMYTYVGVDMEIKK